MSETIAKFIDHTALKPETTKEQIIQLCNEAKEHKFASVCVNPSWVKLVSEQLENTEGIEICTVIGFPLGATTTEVKKFETENAIKNGATEIDMVINIAALKEKDSEYVKRDISAVVEEAKGKAHVKVIIESCLLTDEEKVRACELSVAAGADFVKTSTGFSTGGATIEDIRLMRETVGPIIGVKASGGIRDLEGARAMIEAGATRIGASAGVSIANEERANTSV